MLYGQNQSAGRMYVFLCCDLGSYLVNTFIPNFKENTFKNAAPLKIWHALSNTKQEGQEVHFPKTLLSYEEDGISSHPFLPRIP